MHLFGNLPDKPSHNKSKGCCPMKLRVFLIMLLLALLACLPALAEDTTAFLAFTNQDGSQSYWGYDDAAGVRGKTSNITGDGTYTVSVTFDQPIKDIYFSQIIIRNADNVWPNSTLEVLSVKIDRIPVSFSQGITMSGDDGSTVLSLWDPWFQGIDYNYSPRAFDGNLNRDARVLKMEDFLGAKRIEVKFRFSTGSAQAATSSAAVTPVPSDAPLAILAFTNKSETQFYWGTDSGISTGVTAPITGDGLYTISANFTVPIKEIYFSEILIKNCEKKWPKSTIQITSIKMDGRKINFAKGFTCSTDGNDTIMSLWDPWFTGINRKYNPRSYDGNLSGARRVLQKNDFMNVSSIEIQFYFSTGE